MDDIVLKSECSDNFTLISNNFIDCLMPSANGEYVKVYLYLLRCFGDPAKTFNIADAADTFESTEKDIQRALNYWERTGLIGLNYNKDKLIEITLLNTNSKKSPEPPKGTKVNRSQEAPSSPAVPTIQAIDNKQTFDEKTSFTVEDLENFCNREEVADITLAFEHYMGRPLGASELQSLLWWHEELGFTIPLIEYLIEYCLSRGHKSFNYIDTVAKAWANENIKTVEQAKRLNNLFSTANHTVMKAFGISGRTLTDPEIAIVTKWTSEYGFSTDIIAEACNRTIMQTHDASFAYADSILKGWHTAGVTGIDDIAKLDEKFNESRKTVKDKVTNAPSHASANKFKNFSERDYDFKQLEEELVNRNLN